MIIKRVKPDPRDPQKGVAFYVKKLQATGAVAQFTRDRAEALDATREQFDRVSRLHPLAAGEWVAEETPGAAAPAAATPPSGPKGESKPGPKGDKAPPG